MRREIYTRLSWGIADMRVVRPSGIEMAGARKDHKRVQPANFAPSSIVDAEKPD